MKCRQKSKKNTKPIEIGYEEHVDLICICQQDEEEPFDTFAGINDPDEVVVDFKWKHWETDWAVCEQCGRVVDLETI